MTIQIDDAGWGDPVGGVILGIFRIETNEYLVKEIEVTHFQGDNFAQKTFLDRGLKLVLNALQCLKVARDEPIQVCRGAVLDGVRAGLKTKGYDVIPTKIEGYLQELVETSFVDTLASYGIVNLPRVSGKERFFRQLEWVQDDFKRRERFAKTGWKNWSTKLRRWRPKWRRGQANSMAPPIIIKLGGSIISDKTKRSTARLKTIRRLASEIATVTTHPIIVIHGGGSFGHFPAQEYTLREGGKSKRKKLGVTETALEMNKLTHRILSAFHEVNRPAILIRSSSAIVSINGRISHMDLQALREFLRQGFIPILSGDVVADTVTNFTIVSGDQIAMYLARILQAKLVIFATDVDGLYTADPKEQKNAQRIELITPETVDEILQEIAVGEAVKAADVTAGMRGKLAEIFKGLPENCEVLITDIRKPGTLQRIIAGQAVPATRLRQGKV
ncbi:MAG: isopentenyl phosphate kinase [Candidatus Hodarchaeota archaeon]